MPGINNKTGSDLICRYVRIDHNFLWAAKNLIKHTHTPIVTFHLSTQKHTYSRERERVSERLFDRDLLHHFVIIYIYKTNRNRNKKGYIHNKHERGATVQLCRRDRARTESEWYRTSTPFIRSINELTDALSLSLSLLVCDVYIYICMYKKRTILSRSLRSMGTGGALSPTRARL